MKKMFKKVVAVLLVVTLLLTLTSCGEKESVVFENPLAGKTYSEIMEMAEEINEDKVYATEDNNTFKVTSIKSKKAVFSGVAAIVSVFSIIISTIFGGVYTIPGAVHAAKDKKILEVKLKYTNNSSETVMIGDVLHTAFVIEGEDAYNGTCCYAKGMGLDFTRTQKIKPGKTKNVRLLFENIPKDLLKNNSEFDIYFDVGGAVYTIEYVS